MGAGTVETWNVGFAVAGASIGLGAALVPRLRPTRTWAVALAVAGAASTGALPWSIVLAVALIGTASAVGGVGLFRTGSPRVALDLVAGALVLAAVWPSGPVVRLVVVVATALACTAGRRAPADLPPGVLDAVVVMASVACWAATPDTEAIALVAAALIVGALVDHSSIGGHGNGWDTVTVGVVVTTAVCFEGRPAGASMLLVVTAAVLGRGVIALVRRVGPTGTAPSGPAWAVAGLVGLACFAIARSVGRADEIDPALAVSAVVVGSVLVVWALLPTSRAAQVEADPDRAPGPDPSSLA